MIAKVAFLLCLVCVCKSSYIDSMDKCSIRDEVCCRNSLSKVIKDLSKSGLPEFDIPPLDPLQLKDVHVPILHVLDLTLINGVVKGFKNCVINKYSVSIETGQAHLDITCDITIKGRYKAHSSSDVVKDLFGGDDIHGDGNGKIKIEKLNIKLDSNFVLEKRNGEIYRIDKTDKIKYKYEILGKIIFAADNLYLGKVESSKLIIDFLNQNWRDLFANFGGTVMDNAMEIVFKLLKNFYSNVPTRYFLLDDLTPFVSN